MLNKHYIITGEDIKDYFYGYIRGFSVGRLALILYSIIGILVTSGYIYHYLSYRVITGIPILYAVVSGAFHMVSLPVGMYMVPMSLTQREDYIQRQLYVKLLIPVVFGGLCDIVAISLKAITLYTFVLQMISIVSITYICGMLNDGKINATDKKTAYGSLRDFVSIPLVICYLGSGVMIEICCGNVNTVEFWLVFWVLCAFNLLMVMIVGRRWKQIKSNFAEYEKAIETEVR